MKVEPESVITDMMKRLDPEASPEKVAIEMAEAAATIGLRLAQMDEGILRNAMALQAGVMIQIAMARLSLLKAQEQEAAREATQH